MRLTRKQKRWLRQHKGLVNAVKILMVVLVLCCIYFVATLFNEDLKLANLFGGDDNKQIQNESGDSGNGSGNNSANSNKPEETIEAGYVSQLVEFNDTIELIEAEKIAQAYVPVAGAAKPYMIKVNRVMNTVTVYGLDENNFYSVPVKAFVCSTGKNVGDTPVGNGSITDKYTFHPMVDGTYGQYAVRFMSGGILFHSVPYYTNQKNQLETDQFNKLGEVASLGCVRMCVRDSLWIYENCPQGTDVIVYDDTSSPGPLGKPEMIKIPENSQFAGWDPTDHDPANPWAQYSAMITGANDVTLNVGQPFDPRSGVVAVDTCGNDISDKILLNGSYDLGIPGIYTLTYSVTDAIGSSASQTINIMVIDENKAQ